MTQYTPHQKLFKLNQKREKLLNAWRDVSEALVSGAEHVKAQYPKLEFSFEGGAETWRVNAVGRTMLGHRVMRGGEADASYAAWLDILFFEQQPWRSPDSQRAVAALSLFDDGAARLKLPEQAEPEVFYVHEESINLHIALAALLADHEA